jgi:prolyl-tRNA editing enzyme YbaK/EbsC (Cys-tRNA(Pro) deacylase)
MQKLTESFPSLKDHLKKSKNCMIELTQIAVARHLFFARTCGLSRLTHECLNEQMDKEQQCSDWGKRPLSQEQLQYAAKDAFMVQQLSLYLLFDIKKPLKLTLSMLKEHFGVFLHQDTSSSSKYHLYLHLPHDHYDPLLHVLTPQGPEQVKEALTKWPILEADSSFHVLSRTSSLSIVLPEGTIVKSIALCIKETFEMTYALVLLRLDHSIDMEALSQLFQVESCSQIGLADQKTLIQVFGYQRGCLGPFGLRKKKNDEQSQNIQIILDERLLKAERILCGAGEQDLVVGVTTTLFIETIEPIVAAISLDKSHVKP